ncbi:MAG: hypothetical protein M3328_04910 [Chloroflexota bacterium]|nr:hypothetical protein [Chloroflexota bacterium]
MEPYTRRRARTRAHATRESRQTTQVGPQVYYPVHAHLYLGDRTPLYLNWIVEGADGNLYLVPAETDGWSHRTTYSGPREQLKPVDGPMGRVILEMLCVEADAIRRSA